jgi:uncharacterized membrane protein YfcA
MTEWHFIVGATFLLAGFVKGVIGLGLPTVAVGLLGLVMAPAEAAAVLVVPSFVTNVWQLAAGPSFVPLLKRLWPMMLAILAGTAAGTGLLVADSGRATMALGAALGVYGASGLARFRLAAPPRAELVLSPAIGVVTGFISALTGVFVIPAVPYLQALGLAKDDLVQALGLSFTVSTVALALLLAHDGAFEPRLAASSTLAVAPALLGMYLGQILRGRVRERVFRMWFFIGLIALGAHLALRSL